LHQGFAVLQRILKSLVPHKDAINLLFIQPCTRSRDLMTYVFEEHLNYQAEKKGTCRKFWVVISHNLKLALEVLSQMRLLFQASLNQKFSPLLIQSLYLDGLKLPKASEFPA
jgi:hypothetical protein